MRRAMTWLAFAALATSCAPFWSVDLGVRDPGDRAIEDVTLAVTCDSGDTYDQGAMAARSNDRGQVAVSGIGSRFPPDCDIYVAKPGYRTRVIRYRDLCPQGPDSCRRNFEFELVLEPERSTTRVSRGSAGRTLAL